MLFQFAKKSVSNLRFVSACTHLFCISIYTYTNSKIHPNNKIYSSVDAGAHVWTVTSFFAVLCFACLLSSFVSYSSDMVNVKKLYIWTIFVILSNRFFLVEKLWTSCSVQWTYCIKGRFHNKGRHQKKKSIFFRKKS